MPFLELKQPKDFIRVKKYGSATICHTLYDKYFKCKGLVDKRVRIFIDGENKKIGFQPSNEGYKLSVNKSGNIRFRCTPLSKIITGEFYPVWSDEHKMLVADYNEET